MKARNKKELEFILKTASRIGLVGLYFVIILTILILAQ
jgi:hypothetical protein